MAGKYSAANAAMAAQLKANDVKPTSRRCPICNGLIHGTFWGHVFGGLYNHIAFQCKKGT